VDGGTGAAVRAARWGASVAALLLLAGCTGGDVAPAPVPPAPERAAPPPPPAACALDVARMAAATGLTWTPDQATATDGRCVYDPSGSTAPTAPAPPGEVVAPPGSDFVAVVIAPLAGTDGQAELEGLAALCEAGSRAPVDVPDGGFVCRFAGGSVYSAAVRGADLVTVSASAVPAGTTAARMVVALGDELRRIAS
jgi:hypothetical protein